MREAAVVVAAVTLAAAAACPAPSSDRGPVDVSLQLATRQSCGVLSGLDYDTSCMAAVDVRVLDAVTHELITEQCRRLDDTRPTLRAALEGSTPLVEVSKLSANRAVIFQVRGLHDVADGVDGGPAGTVDPASLCANAADDKQWLFWGDSDPVDLRPLDANDSDASHIVRIVLDCRDCTFGTQTQCGGTSCFGCAGVGAGTCPASIPTSFCVPTVACDKACNKDGDCFEGLACVNHVCIASVPSGELCSPCGAEHGGLGCGDGFDCVRRGTSGDAFCADVCPGADHVCAAGTKCTRLGNDLQLAN